MFRNFVEMPKSILLYVFVLINFSVALAQNDSLKSKKEGFNIPAISAYYAYEFAGGDLASRFGQNHKVGATVSFKFKTNWLLTLDAGYMFGEDLKQEAYSILDSLKTDVGQITSKYGTPGNVLMSERGYTIMVKVGKILPFWQTNENSGPILMGGVGFLQHKIRIDNEGNDIPQIYGDYKKGYDHLTNGIAFNEFVGYRHYARNKMMNFYIGVEFTQAFTKNRRAYNYNTMDYDNKSRLDLLYSLKIGMIVPFIRRVPNDFYTY